MHGDLTFIIIEAVIAAILLLIVALLLSSVVRRLWNNRKYRSIDALRAEYAQRVRSELEAPRQDAGCTWEIPVPGSVKWQALELVLVDLMAEGVHQDRVRLLFSELGFVRHYEDGLRSRNVMTRASAIDKLGKMGSMSSLPKLLPLLDDEEPEILAVVVRALSRLGSEEALGAIVQRLPVLLGRSLVTRKAMDTALLNFGDGAIPHLIQYHDEHADPWVLSCVLETLSHLSPDERSARYAAAFLSSANPEVRSKALKVLGRPGLVLPVPAQEQIVRLLEDTVWFVRIQAIKTAFTAMRDQAAKPIARLLFDANWQVRNESATALTKSGNEGLRVIAEVLTSTDRYAKESICEEMEKTGYCEVLLRNCGSADEKVRSQSICILTTMHGLHFSTPLLEYLAHGENEGIKGTVRSILKEGPQ